MAKASAKERRARILGVVTLGAIVAISVSYVIAPRFSEPAQTIQRATEELDKKILLNERAALLKGQENSLDSIVEELAQTSAALPNPSTGADAALKAEIEDMLRQIGLSPNSLVTFLTPNSSNNWVAVTNPALVYDPSKVGSVSAEGSSSSGITMYQKPLVIEVQGPEDRLVQVARRISGLTRAVAVDSLVITGTSNLASPTLTVQARIFLMPAVESELVDASEDDGEITEVDTPFG